MSYYELLNDLEKLIIEFSNDNAAKILMLIQQDNALETELFRRLKSCLWFMWLRDSGFFKPENIKYNSKGYAIYWDIVDYLEKVSEQVSQNPEYGKELIDIIKNTVEFSIDKKKIINNFYIWQYFVKIIKNIPNPIIVENFPMENREKDGNISYGFRTWLFTLTEATRDSDFIINDIADLLLGKFLEDDNTIKYAEAIMELMTWIQPKNYRSSITGRDDAVMKWNSYWILEAFKKNRINIGKKCSKDSIVDIAGKLEKALEYEQSFYDRIIETEQGIYRLKVSRVKDEKIGENEIGFIENTFESDLSRYASKQIEGINLKEDPWPLYHIEPETGLQNFRMIAKDKETFILKLKDNLSSFIKNLETGEFEKETGQMFDGLFEDYSNLWAKSLSGIDELNTNNAKNVISIILRDILIAKCEVDIEIVREILNIFLTDKYRFPIFRKFVLFFVHKQWAYQELLYKFFDITSNPLEKANYNVELYDILHNNYDNFTFEFKEHIKKQIFKIPDYFNKKEASYIAYWQYRWLSPLSGHPEFSEAYSKARKEAEVEEDRPYEPERSMKISAGFVGHVSSLSKEQILQMPISELIKYINEFKEVDSNKNPFDNKPDREGLARVLQSAVAENPSKFCNEISVFLQVDYYYLYHIFRGFIDAWRSKKELVWGNLFDFIIKYMEKGGDEILKEALKAQGDDFGNGRYIWMVEVIVDLIEEGSRDDHRAFDHALF